MLETIQNSSPETLAEIRREMKLRKTKEVFLLFSLGSQFDHLIVLLLGKIGVYCVVADPATITVEDVQKIKPRGIILSGGPASVYDRRSRPPFDDRIFDLGIPVLGICLGFQLWAHHLGIAVSGAAEREFSTHTLQLTRRNPLLKGVRRQSAVLQSHGDIVAPDSRLTILGTTENSPVAAARYKHLYGVQFHPEVTETEAGEQILTNFCFGICGAKDRYPAEAVAERKIKQLRQQIGKKRVLLALSGGSDSSVVAYLLKQAIRRPGQVRAIYIKGLDRQDDEVHVLEYFSSEPWLELKVIDATVEFARAVRGLHSMKSKRRAMKRVYKRILNAEARAWRASFVAQGTLYTDISESGGGYRTGARKAVIKVHHNVDLDLVVPELTPLADCVKDGARNIGRTIGVPEALLTRHPFPGPGLLMRIEKEVTRRKLELARRVDGIWISELRRANLYHLVWQAGAVVTDSFVTCSKGDDAVTGRVIRLWAVWSVNGFTARAAELGEGFIKAVCRRITNEVREAGSVDYRYSDKPPATIECG